MDIGKRILVVDDEPLSVTTAIDYLKDAGYIPHFVTSGQQAWQVLNENPDQYHAVIVDRIMPELNGIDLLCKIKKSIKLQNLPVIIETASEDTDSYIAALEAGAYDLVYKPLEKNFLLYVVGNAVENC
jgi:DNA-binding response OmpR family regulator